MNKSEFKLCYVEGPWAWFTTQSLDKQWGDDWNDAPFEHNAGQPYESRSDSPEWQILRLAWWAPWSEGAEAMRTLNFPRYGSGYVSVEDINRKGIMPWIVLDYYGDRESSVEVWAGTPLLEFIAAVEAARGEIYLLRQAEGGDA